MNSASAHRVVGLSTLWLAIMVIASRDWTTKARPDARSARAVVRDFITSKTSKGSK